MAIETHLCVATAMFVASCASQGAEPTAPRLAVPEPLPIAAAASNEDRPALPGADAGTPNHRCSKDPGREAPTAAGALGGGSRFAELVNDGTFELLARLLDVGDRAAVEGTLRVPAGGSGRFRIEPGTYRIRYRNQETCGVFLGLPFTIGPEHEGVSIHIRPVPGGGRAPPRPVDEEL